MTTPKDTWISVNDAMPPNEIPKDCCLLFLNKFDDVFECTNDRGRIRSKDGYDLLHGRFWMLLSKPKTTN